MQRGGRLRPQLQRRLQPTRQDRCHWGWAGEHAKLRSSSSTTTITTTSSSSSLPLDSTTQAFRLVHPLQMSTAMIRGWLDAGLTTPTRVCTSDRGNSNQHLLSSIGLTTFGEAASGGAQSVAAESDIIVIGVKPQIMPDVLAALRPHVQPHHLVVSIAAGITLATYQQALPPGTRVIRVMPNTPLLVGAGASAYCLGQHARPEDEERIKALLGSSGLVVKVGGAGGATGHGGKRGRGVVWEQPGGSNGFGASLGLVCLGGGGGGATTQTVLASIGRGLAWAGGATCVPTPEGAVHLDVTASFGCGTTPITRMCFSSCPSGPDFATAFVSQQPHHTQPACVTTLHWLPHPRCRRATWML